MTSGDVLLCDLNPVAGREQGGVRPVVVVQLGRVDDGVMATISRYLHLFIA
jgi:mRNA-degrading endonuclease toxin of MazEF toxin-antitoxin module